ncbi:hypothetical protein ACHAXR_010881 [Thalassiosira sp. AJA248-18]
MTNALMFILALFVVHDVGLALTSSAGAATIAQAYARPPSYVSRSPPNREENKCSCFDRKQPYNLASCKLRCGGINDIILQPRHATYLSMTRTKNDTDEVVKNNAKYHLIWSQHFLKKMAISAILWCFVQYLFKKNTTSLEKVLFSHEHTCHGQSITTFNRFQRAVPTAVVLPLLSSSCCAIQLMINALSGWGCAGFNTYLGPIRPILLPILLFSTWKLLPQRPLGWTILSLILAFLPELVDIWNTNRSRQWQQKHVDDDSKNVVEESTSTSSYVAKTAKLRLNIPTMGCVACVNKVDTSIRQCKSAPNIREETSWLTDSSAKGGMAELLISAKSNEDIDLIAEEVVDAVKNAGFHCDVESLQVDN